MILNIKCVSPNSKERVQGSHEGTGTFGADVVNGSRSIYLCPSFFDKLSAVDYESPWVIVHEIAHLSGAGLDIAYFTSLDEPPLCNEVSHLSSEQALKNADSYAYFAFCVSR